MFGNHGLCGLLKEGAHEKSPKYLGGNLGDFGEFCKGLILGFRHQAVSNPPPSFFIPNPSLAPTNVKETDSAHYPTMPQSLKNK